MWHLLDSVKLANIVKAVHGGREATVLAKDLVLDQGSQGQVVEAVGKIPPNVRRRITSNTFIKNP